MRSFCILLLLSVPAARALSQDAVRTHTWELSGTVSYSYSSQSDQDLRPYSDYLWVLHTHQMVVQPSFGYFLLPGVQLTTDLRYTLMFAERNISEGQFIRNWSHGLGLSLGPVYNHSLNSSTDLFLGIKAGLGWTRLLSSYPYSMISYLGSPDSGWKKAEVSFPMLVGGTKVFLSDEWALVFQGQYVRTSNFNGGDNTINSALSVGVGVSVFL